MWFTLGEGNPSEKEKNNSFAGNTKYILLPTNQRSRCECIVSCIIGYPNILEQSNKKQQKLGFVPANFIKVDQNEGKSEKMVKMTKFKLLPFLWFPKLFISEGPK